MNIPKLTGYIESRYEFEGSGLLPLQYDVRGHVDPAEFIAALELEYGRGTRPELVKHVYARNVPVGRDRPGEMIQMLQDHPGRGAFPITVVDYGDTWSEDDAKWEEGE